MHFHFCKISLIQFCFVFVFVVVIVVVVVVIVIVVVVAVVVIVVVVYVLVNSVSLSCHSFHFICHKCMHIKVTTLILFSFLNKNKFFSPDLPNISSHHLIVFWVFRSIQCHCQGTLLSSFYVHLHCKSYNFNFYKISSRHIN